MMTCNKNNNINTSPEVSSFITFPPVSILIHRSHPHHQIHRYSSFVPRIKTKTRMRPNTTTTITTTTKTTTPLFHFRSCSLLSLSCHRRCCSRCGAPGHNARSCKIPYFQIDVAKHMASKHPPCPTCHGSGVVMCKRCSHMSPLLRKLQGREKKDWMMMDIMEQQQQELEDELGGGKIQRREAEHEGEQEETGIHGLEWHLERPKQQELQQELQQEWTGKEEVPFDRNGGFNNDVVAVVMDDLDYGQINDRNIDLHVINSSDDDVDVDSVNAIDAIDAIDENFNSRHRMQPRRRRKGMLHQKYSTPIFDNGNGYDDTAGFDSDVANQAEKFDRKFIRFLQKNSDSIFEMNQIRYKQQNESTSSWKQRLDEAAVISEKSIWKSIREKTHVLLKELNRLEKIQDNIVDQGDEYDEEGLEDDDDGGEDGDECDRLMMEDNERLLVNENGDLVEETLRVDSKTGKNGPLIGDKERMDSSIPDIMDPVGFKQLIEQKEEQESKSGLLSSELSTFTHVTRESSVGYVTSICPDCAGTTMVVCPDCKGLV